MLRFKWSLFCSYSIHWNNPSVANDPISLPGLSLNEEGTIRGQPAGGPNGCGGGMAASATRAGVMLPRCSCEFPMKNHKLFMALMVVYCWSPAAQSSIIIVVRIPGNEP